MTNVKTDNFCLEHPFIGEWGQYPKEKALGQADVGRGVPPVGSRIAKEFAVTFKGGRKGKAWYMAKVVANSAHSYTVEYDSDGSTETIGANRRSSWTPASAIDEEGGGGGGGGGEGGGDSLATTLLNISMYDRAARIPALQADGGTIMLPRGVTRGASDASGYGTFRLSTHVDVMRNDLCCTRMIGKCVAPGDTTPVQKGATCLMAPLVTCPWLTPEEHAALYTQGMRWTNKFDTFAMDALVRCDNVVKLVNRIADKLAKGGCRRFAVADDSAPVWPRITQLVEFMTTHGSKKRSPRGLGLRPGFWSAAVVLWNDYKAVMVHVKEDETAAWAAVTRIKEEMEQGDGQDAVAGAGASSASDDEETDEEEEEEEPDEKKDQEEAEVETSVCSLGVAANAITVSGAELAQFSKALETTTQLLLQLSSQRETAQATAPVPVVQAATATPQTLLAAAAAASGADTHRRAKQPSKTKGVKKVIRTRAYVVQPRKRKPGTVVCAVKACAAPGGKSKRSKRVTFQNEA